MTTGQLTFEGELQKAEASFTAPGFRTLTANQRRIAILRRAIRNLGGDPVGTSFPGPRDEPIVINALEIQLVDLVDFNSIAAPYNENVHRATIPEITAGDDPRLLATETGEPAPSSNPTDRPVITGSSAPPSDPFAPREEEQVISQAASAPHPNTPVRDRAVDLQWQIRDLGATPVVDGYIPLAEAFVAVTRLNNQLNALLNPAPSNLPTEFSSDLGSGQLPVDEGLRFVGQPVPPQDVDPTRLAQVETLRERIRAAGGRPEFSGTLTRDNVLTVVDQLSNQLERLLAVQRAQTELQDSAIGLDVLDSRETRIMALQQAIRDYGEVPVITGEVRESDYSSALIALDRQLKELVSRPDGFDQSGINTDPFSTDSLADAPVFERPPESTIEPEFDNPTGFMTVIEAYREIEPLFAPGHLAPLLLSLLTIPNFKDLTVEEQTLHFLKEASDKAGLTSAGFTSEHTSQEKLETLLTRLRGWTPRGGELRVKEPETFGHLASDLLSIGSKALEWSGTQLISDDIADGLPDYLRLPTQALLNLTAPVNFALLFVGGVGISKIGRDILGEVVGGILGQVAEDHDLPEPLPMFLEVLGGVVARDIGAEFAGASSKMFARAAAKLGREIAQTPEDTVKFFRLVKDGKFDEAMAAAQHNFIDDVGDVAGAARFAEFRKTISLAAAEQGLTDAHYLAAELSKGMVVELIESYGENEFGSSISSIARLAFPFGLILDEELVEFLRTAIMRSKLPNATQRGLSLEGLDSFLVGKAPTDAQIEAFTRTLGEEFAESIRKAVRDGLLA